jgi:hypothetical protein
MTKKIKAYDTRHGGNNVSRRIAFTHDVHSAARQIKLRLALIDGKVTRIPDWYVRWFEIALAKGNISKVKPVRCRDRKYRELIFIPKTMYAKIERFTKVLNKRRDKTEFPEPLSSEDVICSLARYGMRNDPTYSVSEAGAQQ